MTTDAARRAQLNYERVSRELSAHLQEHEDTQPDWPCPRCRELSRSETIAANQCAALEHWGAQMRTEEINRDHA